MKFSATLLLNGTTATGIQVPDAIVEGLGAGKRPAVVACLNGYTYRSSVCPMHGKFFLPVSREHRDGAGIQAGEEVEVELTVDTAPREVQVPADLQAAMDAEPGAKNFFDSLSYSNKLKFVLSVEGAKTTETRLRRIEKTLSMLSEGRTQ